MKEWVKVFAVAMFVLVGFQSCAQSQTNYQTPRGYDLNSPEEFFLWDALHEISGIVFPEASADTVLAVEDENGYIYHFTYQSKKLGQTKFAKGGDYEGIASSKGFVIVLRSDGRLFTVPTSEIGSEEAQHVKEWKDLIPKDEYESLAASADGLLYVLCKKCDVDKKADQTTGYIFSMADDGEIQKTGQFTIDNKQVDQQISLKGKNFRPSALTENPLTGEWFILSSINKMLVVTNQNWQVLSVYPLNPRLFNQPEGIAFDHKGNLYISNEGGDVTKKGTLLKFNYIP